MAVDSISDNLHRLNENIKSFAESSAEYYKLDLFNKSMRGATSLIKFLVLGFFLLLSFSLVSLALAILISNALDAPSSGFFIMGGFYLLLFLFVKYIGGKHIEKFLLIKFSRMYFEKFDHEDEDLKRAEAERAELRYQNDLHSEAEMHRDVEFERKTSREDETI